MIAHINARIMSAFDDFKTVILKKFNDGLSCAVPITSKVVAGDSDVVDLAGATVNSLYHSSLSTFDVQFQESNTLNALGGNESIKVNRRHRYGLVIRKNVGNRIFL